MIVTPSEDDVFTALRAFLQTVLGDGTLGDDGFIVVAGQDNRVPEPKNPNFIVFWPLRMPRLSTNSERLVSGGLQATVTQSSQCVIQLDVHGPESFNNASIISTMFRSGFAVDFFADIGDTIAPLYADDPRQAPFNSGEQQYENRYMVEANLQVNQTVTTVAQSANALSIGLVDVDTPPDSWPNSIASAP